MNHHVLYCQRTSAAGGCDEGQVPPERGQELQVALAKQRPRMARALMPLQQQPVGPESLGSWAKKKDEKKPALALPLQGILYDFMYKFVQKSHCEMNSLEKYLV